MSPDFNLESVSALFRDLRNPKPQLIFNLLLMISLTQNDQLPKDWDAFQTAVSRLKTSNKSIYEIAIEMMSRLDKTETTKLLNAWGQITKAKYFDQNRHSFINAVNNSVLSTQGHYMSDETLSEFIKYFAVTKNEGTITSIFDPAFGLGQLIFSAFSGSKGPDFEYTSDQDGNEVEVIRMLCKKVSGIEINSEISQLANIMGESLGFDIDVKISDALILEQNPPAKYEMVVCEPPVGYRLSENHLKQDWPFGRPPRSSADWAWAQIIQTHIKAKGYGLMFIPTGALFRSNQSEVLIRAKMVNAGVIKAVINLPAGLAATHSLKLALIIFGTGQENNVSDQEILFIDIANSTERKDTHQHVSSIISKIHDACDEFEKFEQGHFKNIIGYAASLKCNDPELLKSNMNLNPSRYVTKLVAGVNTKFSVKRDINQSSKKVQELSLLIKKAEMNFSQFNVKAEFINLGDLISSEKLLYISGTSKNELRSNRTLGIKYNAESGDRLGLTDSKESVINYISVDDIRRPGELKQSGVLRPDMVSKENSLISTEPDDVVFIKTGRPAAKVDKLGKNTLLSPLSVLRITEAGRKVISPELLAFVLNSERVKKFIQGSTIGRLMIESIPIPIMDTVNSTEINTGLDLIQRLLIKSNDLNAQLSSLEEKLGQVLAGEFEGLEEER